MIRAFKFFQYRILRDREEINVAPFRLCGVKRYFGKAKNKKKKKGRVA